VLIDCSGPGASECFIVEGRSAAEAIARVRDRQSQAVFALQGKIPNCATAKGLRRALASELVLSLLHCVRVGRFSEFLILFDADIDGVHARFLLETLLRVQVPELIDRRQVVHIYPPLFQWHDRASQGLKLGYSQKELRHRVDSGAEVTYFKGIAGLPAGTLAESCVIAESRNTRLLTRAGAATDGDAD
jgi:DNA gyrase subunit B